MAYENDQSLYYAKQVPMQELVTYAGFTPVRRGSVFCLKEHDSFVIFPNKNKERKTTGFAPKVSSKKLEEEGFLGEQCVYRFLCDKSEGRPVNWVSENAKKTGVNPEGAAGAGYDMEYYNSKNEICYVEVKASTEGFEKGIRFYLSENEYNFAKSNGERYYVYYVANVRSSTPEIKVLDNLFVENQFNENAYSISVREYCVRAEVAGASNKLQNDLMDPSAKE